MMYDLAWKVSDVPAVSTPSKHWQESSFSNEAEPGRGPRPGHSLGSVNVRQSVAPQLQPKLTVSQPGDRAEVEADNMAAAVMSMPDPGAVAARQQDDAVMPMHLQRKCTQCEKNTAKLDEKGASGEEKKESSPSTTAQAQRMPEEEEKVAPKMEEEEQVATMPEEEEKVAPKMEEEEQVATMPEEEEKVAPKMEEEEQVATMPEEEEAVATKSEDEEAQTKSRPGGAPTVTPGLQSDIQTVHSAGAPMSKDSREFFEPRFGADFSNVRIHTGTQAAGVARQLNAKAFTVGNNITFGEGQYSPSSGDGKQLMAHELTHVIQQRGPRS